MHVTHDMWHMTHGGKWTFSKNDRSIALMVWKWRGFEDIMIQKLDQLANLQLTNNMLANIAIYVWTDPYRPVPSIKEACYVSIRYDLFISSESKAHYISLAVFLNFLFQPGFNSCGICQ